MPTMTFPLTEILPLSEQIKILRRPFPRLDVTDALAAAARIKNDPSKKDAKYVAVLRSTALQLKHLHIRIAVEAMHKNSKWRRHEPPKPFTSMESSIAASFMRDPHTKSLGKELAARQPSGDIIIIPLSGIGHIRGSSPLHDVGRFVFDISSTAWFLMTHMQVCEHLEQDIRFAATGEHYVYKGRYEVVCFEFVRGEFHIRLRPPQEVRDMGHLSLVGWNTEVG